MHKNSIHLITNIRYNIYKAFSKSMNIIKYFKNLTCILLSVFIILMHSLPVFAQETFYDFSDEAQERFDTQEQQIKPEQKGTEIDRSHKIQSVKKNKKQQESYTAPSVEIPQAITLKGNVIMVPKDTSFFAVLQSSISSNSLTENDTICATLYQDWVYNGSLIAPAGSILYGKAVDVKHAGYAYSNGRLSMSFDEIITSNGERIKLTSNKVYVEAKSSNRAMKMAANVAVGALSGLVTGVLYSLISGGDVARGVAIGSAVGAGGGLVSAAAHRGDEAEVPAGTIIEVVLTKSMEVVPYE